MILHIKHHRPGQVAVDDLGSRNVPAMIRIPYYIQIPMIQTVFNVYVLKPLRFACFGTYS